MQIIDLTHTIAADMPVYPGTEQPVFAPANTYEENGFKETLVTFYTHTGTHMDPPAHLFESGLTLDRLPASHFVGKAAVVDCRDLGLGGRATMEHVRRCPAADQAEYLLFNFGWDQYWNAPEYFADYPCITPEVVDYLLETNKKGVGLDTIGLDAVSDENLTLHKQLLTENKTVIIENLTGLEQLTDAGLFTFCALPLKMQDADGSPIRAIAILD